MQTSGEPVFLVDRVDGLKVVARQDKQGRRHMDRHTGDSAPHVYARFDSGDDFAIREPRVEIDKANFELLPNGRLVTREGNKLVRRDEDGWVLHQTLPDRPVIIVGGKTSHTVGSTYCGERATLDSTRAASPFESSS